MGCVTCHTCHGCVTHFRPILGNIVEVTLMTLPILYIVSHAKGTYFPLARISSSIPLWTYLWVSLTPGGWGPSLAAGPSLAPLTPSLYPGELVVTTPPYPVFGICWCDTPWIWYMEWHTLPSEYMHMKRETTSFTPLPTLSICTRINC